MFKKIDIAVSKVLASSILNVHGAADPLDLLLKQGSLDNVHGLLRIDNVHGGFHAVNVHGAIKIENVHGAHKPGTLSLTLPKGQKVSRIEVCKGSKGDLLIRLHE